MISKTLYTLALDVEVVVERVKEIQAAHHKELEGEEVMHLQLVVELEEDEVVLTTNLAKKEIDKPLLGVTELVV